MPQLTETEINIRKQTLESDLQQVKESLNKLDTERTNLVAQHHAINGAIQQCDLFLKQIEEKGEPMPAEKQQALDIATS